MGRLILLICALSLPFIAPADTFSGRVVDETGSPLAGAAVRAEGGGSAITDVEGIFTVEAPGPRAKVQVSYIGFATENFVLTGGADGQELSLKPAVGSLEEVVVTATRTPKALKDVPVVTRLITAEDIRKADATDIQDLLTQELPGLEFTYAMSQETALNMNGFGGNAVLFLVDGERLAGETMDNVDFNRLNLENVGKVEVVKGASSALYGANAVGGVVNLISRQSDEPLHLSLNSRYRSTGDEWRAGGDLGFHSGKWTSNTDFQFRTVKTVKLTDAFDTESNLQYMYGGRNVNVRERLTFQPSNALKLTARGGYFNRTSNRINYVDHYLDYTGGLRGEWTMGRGRSLEMSYGYDQYDKRRHVGGVRTHDHDYSNRQNTLHALYTQFFGKNALTAGADFLHDYLRTYQFADGATHSQATVDAFAQFDWSPLDWLNLVASVREDYFSESKNNSVTARLAAMFKFGGFSLRANYAGGFRAPTLKEMYMSFDMAGIQMIYGNPDLKPEKSHNVNLALEYDGRVRGGFFAGSYSISLMGYYNYYNSRITTTDYPGDADRAPGAIYCNEDGVKVSGIDLSARYRLANGLGAQLNYNYLHTAGRKVDSQFSNPRPHSMTWRLDFERRLSRNYRLYAGISGRYLAKPQSRYATDGAYSVWKLTVRQDIWRGVGVNFAVDNLFNYRPKVYYWNSLPTTGREWSVGLALDIDTMLKR